MQTGLQLAVRATPLVHPRLLRSKGPFGYSIPKEIQSLACGCHAAPAPLTGWHKSFGESKEKAPSTSSLAFFLLNYNTEGQTKQREIQGQTGRLTNEAAPLPHTAHSSQYHTVFPFCIFFFGVTPLFQKAKNCHPPKSENL